jgi:hypothetical protein
VAAAWLGAVSIAAGVGVGTDVLLSNKWSSIAPNFKRRRAGSSIILVKVVDYKVVDEIG